MIEKRSEGQIDASELFGLMKMHGAIGAGSCFLSAYVGDSMDLVDDIDIFVPMAADYPPDVKAAVLQIHAEANVPRFDQYPAPIVEVLRRFAPLMPPIYALHPLEEQLWSKFTGVAQIVEKHYIIRAPWGPAPKDRDKVWANCTEIPSGEAYGYCKHAPTPLLGRTCRDYQNLARTFTFGSLKLSIIHVDLTNHGSLYAWMQQYFDIVACSDVCFDGERLLVRHHDLLMRKWTWLRPCRFDHLLYYLRSTTEIEHAIFNASHTYASETGPRSNPQRVAKYVRRGWQFLDPRKLSSVSKLEDALFVT